MAIQFEATTNYLGKTVTVKTDSFAELHRALAGVSEMNRDFRTLAAKDGVEAKRITPDFRTDSEGNEYYGVRDVGTGKNITFGQKRDKALIPFFPKGDDGYYDPSAQGNPSRNGRGGRQDTSRQEAPRQNPPRQSAPQQNASAGSDPSSEFPKDDLPF